MLPPRVRFRTASRASLSASDRKLLQALAGLRSEFEGSISRPRAIGFEENRRTGKPTRRRDTREVKYEANGMQLPVLLQFVTARCASCQRRRSSYFLTHFVENVAVTLLAQKYPPVRNVRLSAKTTASVPLESLDRAALNSFLIEPVGDLTTSSCW